MDSPTSFIYLKTTVESGTLPKVKPANVFYRTPLLAEKVVIPQSTVPWYVMLVAVYSSGMIFTSNVRVSSMAMVGLPDR